jgi:GT2 family glycosyltransferase/glycosyltransferase involved in cell wall biosynthesis
MSPNDAVDVWNAAALDDRPDSDLAVAADQPLPSSFGAPKADTEKPEPKNGTGNRAEEAMARATGTEGAKTAQGGMAMGSIDKFDHDSIAGWVWDPTRPDELAEIELLDGDSVVLRLPADRFRDDLLAAGIGDGRHGFAASGLSAVFPYSRHRVRVRRASDGRDLPGSPTWIVRPGFDARGLEFLEQATRATIWSAQHADDLIEPLTLMLSLLNDLVNNYEGLNRAQEGPRRSPAIDIAETIRLTDHMRDLTDRLLFNYPPLHFVPAEQPDVSIVIPVHNKFSYTYDCLKSIQDALPQRTFEVIIVDDCSTDETMLASLVLSGAVRILRNVSNLGFVGTCNAGAAVAKGRYLFFLNNDTLVRDGWLDELVTTFERVPNVGIAGSQLLFADGKLQEAGGIVWRMGDAWNWGRGAEPEEPRFSYLRDADYVSGAALMIERALFQRLGGFDSHFAPAYYEDTDLAFRVRAEGKRVVVQPASRIVHLEGVSAGTDTAASGMKRYQAINHHKFYQRWKSALITHRFNGEQPELEAERLVKKRAYFIDDTVPTPDQDAGSNAAVEHMRALLELGYKVTFLPADNMAKIDPYTGELQKLGIECLYYPFRWSVEEEFRKTAHKPDLVYLHRHTNASKYASMVRRYFPDCRIVYNVADLHFLRMERQARVEGDGTVAAAARRLRQDDLVAMEAADCVIVHSPFEAELLRKTEPRLKTAVVPWTVYPRPVARPFVDRSGLAFVGGYRHIPNVDAARFLVGEIVPALRRLLPDCMTYLVGSNMPAEVSALQGPGVAAVGFVPALADIFCKLRCTVVPLRYGAGIKGKVLESFAHGLPCVMSEVAAEGMELPEPLGWLVARSPAEYAEKLMKVHEDAAFNQKLVGAGLEFIRLGFGAEVVKEALRAAVTL